MCVLMDATYTVNVRTPLAMYYVENDDENAEPAMNLRTSHIQNSKFINGRLLYQKTIESPGMSL